MIKEVITNVIKHSGASEVNINAKFQEDRLLLKISDNGVGIIHKSIEEKSYGISSIKNRAEELGGKAKLTSDKTGTTWEFLIPVDY